MTATKNFSVLISLYCKEKPAFLDAALRSVFEQTLKPAEVVLVLDGAITTTLQTVVDKYSDLYPQILKVVPLPQNVGLGPALNEGLKYCTHELVARMDTDDICKPDRFEKQIATFAQYPEIDIMSAWVEEFSDTPDKIITTRKLPQTHNELRRYARSRSPFNHPAVMYRKSKVLECGGYELLGFLDDYVLWMKMLKSGAVLYNIQDVLLSFRCNSDMYRRRGGCDYAINECRLQWEFYRRGMIALPTAVKNICIRFGVRIAPNALRRFIYQNFLRLTALSIDDILTFFNTNSAPPPPQLIDNQLVTLRIPFVVGSNYKHTYYHRTSIGHCVSDGGFCIYSINKEYRHAA